MHPDDILLNDYVDDALEADARRSVEQHLAECAACRATAEELRAVKDAAAALHHEGMEPPARAWSQLRRAIDRQPRRGGWGWPGMAAAAGVLLAVGAAFAGGLVTGQRIAAPPRPDPQLTELREELRGTRQMVMLSLLRQDSASDRLNGVMWTDRLENPGREVVSALLDTLMHDPNVNVRLATVDALRRFSAEPAVRQGAVQALERQQSPLVQIALIDFLADTKAAESADALRQLSRDPGVDEAVRSRATVALGRIG